jgi:hypothetical protein
MPEASRGRAAESGAAGGPLDSDTESVDPEEAVKRETAVFVPGTHGKKPHG